MRFSQAMVEMARPALKQRRTSPGRALGTDRHPREVGQPVHRRVLQSRELASAYLPEQIAAAGRAHQQAAAREQRDGLGVDKHQVADMFRGVARCVDRPELQPGVGGYFLVVEGGTCSKATPAPAGSSRCAPTSPASARPPET